MAILSWDDLGTRLFTTGVDRGSLYPQNSPGVVWNGLVSIDETPSGADSTAVYIDGQKFLSARPVDSFGCTLEAFTFPDEFEEGVPFNFSYRVKSGNDVNGVDLGYKLHLVYNAVAAPAAPLYSAINDTITPVTFSWDISTTPIAIDRHRASAHLIIDSQSCNGTSLADFEAVLYGAPFIDPKLPALTDTLDFFEQYATVIITDNGDGTWTATGPDSDVYLTDSTHFEIDYFTAVMIDANDYTVYSY